MSALAGIVGVVAAAFLAPPRHVTTGIGLGLSEVYRPAGRPIAAEMSSASRRRVMSGACYTAVAAAMPSFPALAGPSTDLKTDRVVAMNKYQPRIKAGLEFWTGGLRQAISAGDWVTVGKSLTDELDPTDKKGRRRKQGAVLAMYGPMELWASSFSRAAQRSPVTQEMNDALVAFKAATAVLEEATAEKVNAGGLFGFFGAKKELSASDREKKAREGYAAGTKALNSFIATLNTQLKIMGEDPLPTV